jgi:hypothetical protein
MNAPQKVCPVCDESWLPRPGQEHQEVCPSCDPSSLGDVTVALSPDNFGLRLAAGCEMMRFDT